MNRIIVITGASSGIGLASARLFCHKGDKVYCLSRTSPRDEKIRHIVCDVGNENSVRKAFNEIATIEKKIDILILNAGYGISGAAETTDGHDTEQQFNVNFFGAVRCFQASANLLRNSNKGRIVFVSSLAAIIPIPFQSFYSSSKAAILSFSRSVATEMRQFGVTVTAVCPGDVRTAFTENRRKNDNDGVYRACSTKAVKTMEKDEKEGMGPEKIARLLYKISLKQRVRRYYTAGIAYRFFMLLARLLPPSLVDFLVRKIYT